jgi:hypothetical protein
MSNMYGYSDYNGPVDPTRNQKDVACDNANESDSFSDDNPLQVGFWMEGDSLAPPCGTSVETIHRLLDFASVTSEDTLYDLGCGDGRVCLEAFQIYKCRTVGIEVEEDLVQRAEHLISKLDIDCQSAVLPRVVQQDLRETLRELIELANQCAGEGGAGDDDDPQPQKHELPLPTIIVLYLLPEAIAVIQEFLVELLSHNVRIVCNTWGLKGVEIAKKVQLPESGGAITPLYLYTRQK